MTFIVWLYTLESFAKILQTFAQLHDFMKPTFRSSGNGSIITSASIIFWFWHLFWHLGIWTILAFLASLTFRHYEIQKKTT